MVFKTKAILKWAITKYSVTSNWEIKHVKDKGYRLQAVYKEKSCGWVLYTSKAKAENSFVMNTYNGDHNCAMVYKNG